MQPNHDANPVLDSAHLPALHALLHERHVTRAAVRLGVSQSSLSHRLRQLRESLGDALLVPVSGGMALTPRAQRMLPHLDSAMARWRDAVEPPGVFRPASALLHWQLAMPDALAGTLPALVESLRRDSPRARLTLVPVPAAMDGALAKGAPHLAVAPATFAGAETMARPLGTLRFCLVVRRGHPLLRRPITVDRWLAHPHVVVRVDNTAANPVSAALARQGLTREAALEVPGFLAGLVTVAHSTSVMNVPVPLARAMARPLGLVMRPVPVDVPPVPVALMWHARFQADEAHRWTRERIHAVVARALAP